MTEVEVEVKKARIEYQNHIKLSVGYHCWQFRRSYAVQRSLIKQLLTSLKIDRSINSPIRQF